MHQTTHYDNNAVSTKHDKTGAAIQTYVVCQICTMKVVRKGGAISLPFIAETGLRSVRLGHSQARLCEAYLLQAPLGVLHFSHVHLMMMTGGEGSVRRRQQER